jgi:hypothetical protein
MHKLKIFTIALLILVISGCSLQSKKKTTPTIKMTTRQALKPAEKTWTFTKGVSSKQTKKQGVADKLTESVISKTDELSSWTTSKGKFMSGSVNYKQVSFKKWQRDTQKNYTKSAQSKIHYMSITQVNAVLKKLGANFKITKLTDLIFLETKINGMTLPQGFVAHKNQLYALNIQYVDTDQTITLGRGQLFTATNGKKTGSQLSLSKLNGTWIAAATTTSANDTGKLMIKNGYIYQHRYNSFERSAIQDLNSYSLISLNQNQTYALQKANASNAGYQLTRKSVASGDSLGYLYLFINQNKLVRIGQGEVTSYSKTSTLIAANDLPQDDITIFNQMDQKNPGEAASTITVDASAPLVGMSSSIKYLTDGEAGQITSSQAIDFENGKVTVTN